MRRLIHPIKYNSLTIVLSGLFIICIAAQSLAAWRLQDEILAAHRQASVNYWANLSTGAFLEGLATNWQAAFLQLASLILFSGFLYQRGAPHSRDPSKAKSRKNHTNMRATSPGFTAIPFSVVFVGFRRLACTAYRFRREGLQRGARVHGPTTDLGGSLYAFGQILVVNPEDMAGGISGNCALCRAQPLSAPGEIGGIEAGRIENETTGQANK
jgi:hypothetical protein